MTLSIAMIGAIVMTLVGENLNVNLVNASSEEYEDVFGLIKIKIGNAFQIENLEISMIL
jgi:hypothetical protein